VKSTQETNLERNADKIDALERKRLQAIERGLQNLESLDTERVAQELTREDYARHAAGELKRIMRTTEITVDE
jgi:hypothetical protein